MKGGFIMTLKIAEPREPYNTKEDFLELASTYKEAKGLGERNLWYLSDLALEASEKYGGLKEFAKLTEENINSLMQYASMAKAYPEPIRAYRLLSYRHYMVAKSNDSRLEWLEKAEKNAWSAERLRREMNPPKEKPLPVAKIEPVTAPELKTESVKPSQGRTLEEMVGALNWYLVNDKRALELAASDALLFMCLLLGEERKVFFDQNTGHYEISEASE